MFNCGKMQHIFKYEKSENGKMIYTSEFTSAEAELALKEGNVLEFSKAQCLG